MPDLTDIVGTMKKMAEAQADMANNEDKGSGEDVGDGASRSKPEDSERFREIRAVLAKN